MGVDSRLPTSTSHAQTLEGGPWLRVHSFGRDDSWGCQAGSCTLLPTSFVLLCYPRALESCQAVALCHFYT